MRCKRRQLVVVYLSFPTSNHNSIIFVLYHTALYIFRFLHQTTTGQHKQQVHIGLYIFRFLHQTTTINVYVIDTIGCISFVSYIKPQHLEQVPFSALVVYLSFPTSNHNMMCPIIVITLLYIFRFLHQTTTGRSADELSRGCISFVSYIKPQLSVACFCSSLVVYLSFPTSNHN